MAYAGPDLGTHLEEVIHETVRDWRKRARFILQCWKNDEPTKAEPAIARLQEQIRAETDLNILHQMLFEAILLRDREIDDATD